MGFVGRDEVWDDGWDRGVSYSEWSVGDQPDGWGWGVRG